MVKIGINRVIDIQKLQYNLVLPFQTRLEAKLCSETKNIKSNEKPNKNTNSIYDMNVHRVWNEKPNTKVYITNA